VPSVAHSRFGSVALRIDRRSRAFGDVLMQWAALALNASPLLAPELALLTARLAREPEPLLVGVEHGNGLVVALPLARRGRTLKALRSGDTPRVDFVGEPGAMHWLWRAIRGIGAWDALVLRGVPGDSPLAVELPEVARSEGWTATVREIGRAPWFEVQTVEQHIPRRFRWDMRRREEELGGVELERVTAFDREALADMRRLEASDPRRRTQRIRSDVAIARFYAATARVFARRGQLSIAFLRARGKRIAGCFGVEDASIFHLVKMAQDPEFGRYDPGQLLVRETARDAARRGLLLFDMMGRDTPSKRMWTSHGRAHVEIRIYAPTLRGNARALANWVARPVAARLARSVRRLRGEPSEAVS
jgi:CelD/BcsL family acetyltransferase involved in cellulose biosynthesis